MTLCGRRRRRWPRSSAPSRRPAPWPSSGPAASSMPAGGPSTTVPLPTDWAGMVDDMRHALSSPPCRNAVPILFGTDAVHGHNNVFGATVFPHNIGSLASASPG
ncbi:hypothetical protein ABZP36_013776 [Zizania latifolia]